MALPTTLAPNAYLTKTLKAELDLASPIAGGSPKRQVKLVQERLWLAGFKLALDGDFGAATEQQLKSFQAKAGLPRSGVYDTAEHDLLCAPFVNAVNPVAVGNQALGDLIVAVARRHIGQHPLEVGGDNCGPWVRMYMDGNDGAPWKWCAGFCFFVIDQACSLFGKKPPMDKTFSVNTVVERAKTAGQFLSEQKAQPAGRARVVPGSLFVNRAKPSFWSHVGIVSAANAALIHTCEGNTNDDGSSNGYEAIERVRNYKNRDFVIW